MKSSLLLLSSLWIALFSLSAGAWAQTIEPDAVDVMKEMIATYQGISSYSDKTLVMLSWQEAGTGRGLGTSHDVEIAWQKGRGIRVEGKRDHDQFVVHSDGEGVTTHWIPHTQVDSRNPLNGNTDFLSQGMPGLPFGLPDIGFLTGGVTLEKLQQLPITRLAVIRGTVLVPRGGQRLECNVVEMEYTDAAQRSIKLTMHIGRRDNVLYMTTQRIRDGAGSSAVIVQHSDISDNDSFPAEYWTLNAPLMGEAATITAPSPPTQPGVAPTLPTLTGQDVFGKTFTVSPQDKKVTLIYFFNPGAAESNIDHFQQLASEGQLRGLQIVGVVKNLGIPEKRTLPALQAFLTQHKVTFPVYTDAGASLSLNPLQKQLGANNRIATLIYGADGQLKSDASLIAPLKLRAVLNSLAPIPLH